MLLDLKHGWEETIAVNPAFFCNEEGQVVTIPECGHGWAKLIEAVALAAADDKREVKIRATQIKEKFGTLRIYTNVYSEFTHGAIHVADTLSQHTCEQCGRVGQTRSHRGWLQTLCQTCHNEWVDRSNADNQPDSGIG